MAEVVVTAVIGDMVSRVISLLAGQLQDRQSIENKLRRLRHLVIKIQSAVEEAEGRQIKNQGLLEWLAELTDGMYQGRYVLDMFRYGALKLAVEADDEVHHSFSLSSFNPAKRLRIAARTAKSLLFRDDGINELDSALANLQSISGDLREFIMLLEGCPPILDWPITTNLYVDSQMFGRHVERERIINFLLQNNGHYSAGNLGVLPIIGHTGVGKTTLVQHVCNDIRVRNHFSSILMFDFFYMSPMANNETRVVLRSEFISGDMGNLDEPLQVLKHKLNGQRFLIVFENVDFNRKQVLEVLLQSLRCGQNGSKIILTSNNKHVASLGTVEPITLGVLPHAEYWFFFKAHAFGSADVGENPRLVAIGRAIAKRLKGSFYGAKMAGALLRANPNPQFWYNILRSDIWELSRLSPLGEGLAYIADVAENFLPPHIKMCLVTITPRLASPERTFLGLQDLSLASDGGNFRVSHILLCKSVFPFYCLYYTAHCTICSAIFEQRFLRLCDLVNSL